jgi:hypothetical protein
VIRFLDGPAAREVLMLRRAPLFLRAVFNPRKKAEPWDALDQLDDEPKPHEQVHVYVRSATRQLDHVKCGRRSASGLLRRTPTTGCTTGSPTTRRPGRTAAWRAWCYAEAVFVRRVGPPRLTEPSEGPARAN